MEHLSGHKYIALPPFGEPKVYLAVDTPEIAKNSLKMYRVYSKKAVFLKKLIYMFVSTRLINLFSKTGLESEFSKFIRKNPVLNPLGEDLILSKYLATDKDKVILQAQSGAKVIGYIKYALNEEGCVKLEREVKGMLKLKELGIKTLNILEEGSFMGNPYFVSEELEEVEAEDVSDLKFSFDLLKKESKYPLNLHPRIDIMRAYFKELGNPEFLEILEQLVAESQREYAEAYEHGDFSPWNLFIKDGQTWVFDLENYQEYGLEFFDLLAYHFRIATHLQGLDGDELIAYLFQKIDLPRIEQVIIFKLFLLKEIMEIGTFGRMHQVDVFKLLKKEI